MEDEACNSVNNFNSIFSILFGKEKANSNLLKNIEKHIVIQLDETDGLPKLVCSDCEKRIISFDELENYWKTGDNLKLKSIFDGERANIDDILKSICHECNQRSIAWRQFLACLYNDCKSPTRSVTNDREQDNLTRNENKTLNVGVDGKNNGAKLPKNDRKFHRAYYCVAKWCTSDNTTNRMFRIPKDERFQVWLERADRMDLITLDIKRLHYKYLCEKHFTDEMFTNLKKTNLIWNAVPSIFPTSKNFICSSLPTKGTIKNSKSSTTSTSSKCYRPLKIRPTTLTKSPKIDGNKKSHIVSGTEVVGEVNLLPTPSVMYQQPICAQQVIDLQSYDTVIPIALTDPLSLGTLDSSEDVVAPQLSNETFEITAFIEDDLCFTNSKSVDDFCDIPLMNSEKHPDMHLEEETCIPENIVSSDKPKISSNSCNVVLVDPIESFKESDVDSVCSGQGFRESMYPCLACGEVFLMKSSLDQHHKTYHDANF